ncbi:MAG: ArnT family glycosyltransferase [Anaerolineales bacterium]
MKKNKWNFLLTVLFLLVLIVPSHVIGIDKVVTIDEPWWVISGSNYYYALTHGDFENTLYDYHPAVTTTWIVTAGMLSYFPEYRGFGQGYFDVRKPKFEEFMRAHGKEAIDLIRNSRLIQTILLIALALLGYFLLQLLVDQKAAFLAIALAMTGPFFLGHSRLLTHEGMLAMFVLVSFLGMQVYLNKDRRLIYLLISGGAFGLAQLTKSSSIVLIPLFGLILFSGLFRRNEQSLGIKIWGAAKTFVIWLAVAIFVFVLIWPGMWVAPGEMIYEIYGNAFSYVFQGARLEVTQKLQPSTFTLVSGFDGVFQYLRSWAASSTILTWLGLIFALFLLISKGKERLPLPIKSTLIYLALLGGLFIVMFGVAQGRNSPHYILSSYVCFDVIAGIGWGYLWVWVQKQWMVLDRAYVNVFAFILLVGFQIGSTIPYYPYYFTYRNPITNTGGTRGYGEGLAQAAEYLAQKPNSKEIRAYVYNGMGTFSFFFPGETIVLKKIYLVNDDMPAVASETRNADYLVLYPIAQKNLPESEKLLDAFQGVVPEKTIFINDLEYIRIYKTTDIPESVYEEMSR